MTHRVRTWTRTGSGETGTIRVINVAQHRHHRACWDVAADSLSGIALGTIVAIAAYHMARALAPQHMKDSADGAVLVVGGKDTQKDKDVR